MSKKPVKVLLVAEGVHERSGALENLARRLGGNDVSFTAARASDASVRGVHGEGPKGRGHTRRALAWLRKAREENYDALIYLIDDDEGEDKRNEQIREAQEFWKADVPASHLPRYGRRGQDVRCVDAGGREGFDRSPRMPRAETA